MQLTAGKLWGVRRIADTGGRFRMTAVDQRPPIKNPIAGHNGTTEARFDDVAGSKALLIETLQNQSSAMLLDPHYAVPRGIDRLSPTKGLIVTLEDSVFQESPGGRLSSSRAIRPTMCWPRSQNSQTPIRASTSSSSKARSMRKRCPAWARMAGDGYRRLSSRWAGSQVVPG